METRDIFLCEIRYIWAMVGFSLKKIPLLRNLGPRELKRIRNIAKLQTFSTGSIIIKKADAAEHMFVVLSGRVKIFCYSNARKRKTFAYLGPGDFFGEMAVLSSEPRSATVTAVSYTELLVLERDRLERLFSRYPEVEAKIRLAHDERTEIRRTLG